MCLRCRGALVAGLMALMSFFGLARAQDQCAYETPAPWCVELTSEELFVATYDWRCSYGGERIFEDGNAAFWSVVWRHAGSYWYRVSRYDSRTDPQIYQCWPQAYLTYTYSYFLWFQPMVRLKECGFAVCEGKLNPDFLTTR